MMSWSGRDFAQRRIEADQSRRLLPGLRVERRLDSVLGGDDVGEVTLDGDVLEVTALTSCGTSETIRVRLKRWVWL